MLCSHRGTPRLNHMKLPVLVCFLWTKMTISNTTIKCKLVFSGETWKYKQYST